MLTDSDFFQCQQCGHCCQGETTVSLDREDVERLKKFFGLPQEDIEKRYLRISGDVVQMKTVAGHCIFYNQGCTIHQIKSRRCTQWPLHPSILADKANFLAISESCPGINKSRSYEEFCRWLLDWLARAEQA